MKFVTASEGIQNVKEAEKERKKAEGKEERIDIKFKFIKNENHKEIKILQ